LGTHQTLGQRLWSLPGQFFIALLNATSILVIIACVLALLTVSRVDGIAASLAETVSDTALETLNVTPEGFQARLDRLEEKMDRLSGQLQQSDDITSAGLKPELEDLNASLGEISSAIEAITASAPDLQQAAFQQAGQMVTDVLLGFAGCERSAHEAEGSVK